MLPSQDTAPQYPYQVYCGHLFHYDCLNSYMKTPPFTGLDTAVKVYRPLIFFIVLGGKKCPKCGKRIFHEKWKLPPQLAEQRWAHQEARKREIAEVADFLGLN